MANARYKIEFQRTVGVDVAPQAGTWDPQQFGIGGFGSLPLGFSANNATVQSVIDALAAQIIEGYVDGDVAVSGDYTAGLVLDYGGTAGNFPWSAPTPDASNLFIGCPTITVDELQAGVEDIQNVWSVAFTFDAGGMTDFSITIDGGSPISINASWSADVVESQIGAAGYGGLTVVDATNNPVGTITPYTLAFTDSVEHALVVVLDDGASASVTETTPFAAGRPEIAQIVLTNGPDGGTFQLGNVLPWNDTAADVQTGFDNVFGGGVATVSHDGSPWTVTWLTNVFVDLSALRAALVNLDLKHTITAVVTQLEAGSAPSSAPLPIVRRQIICRRERNQRRRSAVVPIVQQTVLPLRQAPRVVVRSVQRQRPPRQQPPQSAAVLILSPRLVR